MTTNQALTAFTKTEIKEFTDKLGAWAVGLSAREQGILAALFADADTRDVNGYDFFSDGGFTFGDPFGGTFGGGFHTASPVSSPTSGTAGGSSGGPTSGTRLMN